MGENSQARIEKHSEILYATSDSSLGYWREFFIEKEIMPPSSATAYSALQSFKAPDPTSVLNQANQQTGVTADQQRVSDLRGAVNNLTTSLNAVDPSVTGRTSGTFTTEAQRSALVNRESQPIQQDITNRSQDLNAANADLNTATGQSNTLTSAILGQGKDTYQSLLDQYNGALASEKAQADAAQQAIANKQEQEKIDISGRAATGQPIIINSGNAAAGSNAPQPIMAPKNNNNGAGGYAFEDGQGGSISAAKYASMTGKPLSGLLQQMAQGGDAGAADAYNKLAQAQDVVQPSQLTAWAKQNLPNFFWDM